jgi:hypothetical protein
MDAILAPSKRAWLAERDTDAVSDGGVHYRGHQRRKGHCTVGRILPKQKAYLFWVFEAAVVRCSMLCHVAVPKLRMLAVSSNSTLCKPSLKD